VEHQNFDLLLRAMAEGLSRRSILRRMAGTAVGGPMALIGMEAAADGEKDKSKDKGKDKNQAKGKDKENASSACRDVGHPCEGNQVCCAGLICGQPGPGNAMRCTTPEFATNAASANQTVVTTNTQVCAGDCDQTNQQGAGGSVTQTVLAEGGGVFGQLPAYWVDVSCAYDAPLYRTVCTCTGLGEPGAPPVRKITLPAADICAFVISEEVQPAVATEVDVTTEASAGTGGVASADASGGSVSVGDVQGSNADIAIDASGGTASADASGGDSNIAIAGGQVAANAAAQDVQPSALVLTLEGNVVPGKLTTYWVDTDSGRRPASGPALVQVAEEPDNTGAIIAEARMCAIPEAQQDFDWFGQCAAPATDMTFTLYSESGGTTPLATMTTNAQGRAHFGNLAPGVYQLVPEGTIWCHAESDRVDAAGNVLVEADLESHVWSFVCGAPAAG
jgi:hypothetical protein